MMEYVQENNSLIKLQVEDKQFNVEKKYLDMCITLKNLIEDTGEDIEEVIPIKNIESRIFEKIINFCKHHYGSDIDITIESELPEWDMEFCNIDLDDISKLLLAGNFLEFNLLINVCCKYIAEQIKGKSIEEMNEILGKIEMN